MQIISEHQGQFETGSEEVAATTLNVSKENLHSERTFVQMTLSPDLKDLILFLDTSALNAFDKSGVNEKGAELTWRIQASQMSVWGS